MKILIVEDDELMAELIRRYLEPVADEVVVAFNLTDAMKEVVKVPPFDLVTLDLNLPESHGLETLRYIDQIKAANPDSLVIVISGTVTADAHEKVLAAGADAFLHKNEFRAGHGSVMRAVRDVAMAVIRTPRRYTRNVELLEKISGRIAGYLGDAASRTTTPAP